MAENPVSYFFSKFDIVSCSGNLQQCTKHNYCLKILTAKTMTSRCWCTLSLKSFIISWWPPFKLFRSPHWRPEKSHFLSELFKILMRRIICLILYFSLCLPNVTREQKSSWRGCSPSREEKTWMSQHVETRLCTYNV